LAVEGIRDGVPHKECAWFIKVQLEVTKIARTGYAALLAITGTLETAANQCSANFRDRIHGRGCPNNDDCSRGSNGDFQKHNLNIDWEDIDSFQVIPSPRHFGGVSKRGFWLYSRSYREH
jgi:hypothetical protein